MAKLEYDECPIGPCPCGKGRRLASMDHGYGSGSSTDYLECPDCELEEKKKLEQALDASRKGKTP